jgi:hypothetical protein
LLRRLALAVGAFALGLPILLQPAQALAAHCVNESKPDGAGYVGDVIVDASTGEVTSIPTNPGGQPAGGFVDVYLDLDGDGSGDLLVADDTFVLNNGQPSAGEAPGIDDGDESVLPDGALNAAGDGKGVGSAAP